jgi:hypothetical protein
MGTSSVPVKFQIEVLPHTSRNILQLLAPFVREQGFYLGGGTALALYLGHRLSRDFDWFTNQPIKDPLKLRQNLQDRGVPFHLYQIDRGTLQGAVSGVRISFFEYRYPLLKKLLVLPETGIRIASLPDLAAMKLSAIAQRGSKKDFIDIYALGLSHFPLKKIVSFYRKKFSIQDIGHVLYALTYFDDADKERMPSMIWKVDWKTIKKATQDWIRKTI